MSRKKKPPKFDRSLSAAQLRSRARTLRRQRLNNRLTLYNNLFNQARRVYDFEREGQEPTRRWNLKKLSGYLNQNAATLNQLNRQTSRLNRNLAVDNFSAIFNEQLRYSPQDANRILNRIRQLRELPQDAGRRVLTGRIRNTVITMSSKWENLWRDVLTRGFYEAYLPTYGSDAIDNIEFEDVQDIGIQEFDIQNFRDAYNARQNNAGFYPYICELDDIDLTKYGIYDNHNTQENCLIYALLEAGIDLAVVNNVKLAVVANNDQNFISRKLLPDIANMVDRYFKLYYIRKDTNLIKSDFYGDKTKPILELAMYLDHIFIYEKTHFTKFSIDNYTAIHELDDFEDKHKDDWFKITKFRVGKSITTASKDSSKYAPIDSLTLVKRLTDNNLLTQKNTMANSHGESNIHTRDNIYLENIKKEQRPTKIPIIKPYDKKKTGIFYADTETFVSTGTHQLYLLSVVSDTTDDIKRLNICDYTERHRREASEASEASRTQIDPEQKLIWDFLRHVTAQGTKDAIVYFHNLKYDFFVLGKWFNYSSVCEKGNQYYSIKIRFSGKSIELRDSYKLLNWRLSDFTKNLGLDPKYSKAEAVNYKFYTPERNNKIVKCADYRSGLDNNNKAIFDKLMNGATEFNATAFYQEYLDLDCLVLKYGLRKFNEIIMQITNNKLSIYDCLTISSLTDKYFLLEGAYEGVYENTGNLRKFISEAIYGGRVHCNTKYVKQVLKRMIADYDGVSLYPSAIFRLCMEKGLPMGEAIRFNQDNIKQWHDMFYSVLRVKITKVNKNQQMPMIASRTEDSIDYLNAPPTENDGIVIIDNVALADYIKFHNIEFELLDGIYYNQGGNKKLGELVELLFNRRLEAKKAKQNALQETLKLMLNSAYGKTIQKPTKQKKSIINRDKRTFNKATNEWTSEKDYNYNRYVINNFNTIEKILKLNDNQVEVSQSDIDKSYNRSQCGAMILSYSKRIMNEVFDVANDLGVNIYYTDTDSIHIDYDGVEKVEDEYRKRYNKELNGKNLGQFHIDFALDGADGEVYATTSIFLGKKSYIDVLECVNKDGKVVKGFHKRLKGITPEGLEHAAKDYPDSYLGLYVDLSKGNSKNILLNPFNTETGKEKVLFDFTRCGSTIGVSTKSEFRRVVAF